MKKLLGDKCDAFDADVFKQLFYQCLPTSIQEGLFTVKSKLPVEDLAALAHDYMATLTPPCFTYTYLSASGYCRHPTSYEPPATYSSGF